MTTEHEAFEAWFRTRWPEFTHSTESAFEAWQAACVWQKERDAAICDAIAADRWSLYKGRPPYTGTEQGRAADFTQGQSDGAEQCADKIRAKE